MGLRNSIRSTGNVQKELDTVRRDLGRLRGDMREVANALAEHSRKNAGQMRENVSDEVADRLDALNRQYATARRYGRRWWRTTRRSAAEHPLGAMLLTLGLGTLLAAILGMLRGGRRR